MLRRWLTAGAGIPLFVGLCYWNARGVLFALGILVVAVVGLTEIVRTYRRQSLRPNLLLAALGLAGPAWVLVRTPFQERAFFALVLSIGLAAMLAEVLQAARTGQMQVARNTAYGLLCAFYVTLFGGISALRAAPGHVTRGAFPGIDRGFATVIVVACCVWATDTAALFVGRAIGKRKLAPLLSPGKTVEGAVAGLCGGLLVGASFGWCFLGAPLLGLVIGGVAGFFGQVGDLFESALKREAGVKDFGWIFPGHGGALDRFDSLLFVAPLVWLLLQAWRQLP